MTRPEHASGTDRVAEVVDRAPYRGFGIVLNVQGDEPFVTRAALAGAVSVVADGRAVIGTAAVVAEPTVLDRSDIVKVVCDDAGRALYFSRAPIPFLREASEACLQATVVRQHVGVYAYSRDALRQWVQWPAHPLELIERLEQLRPLAHGLSIGVVDVEAAAGGIDTEEDLAHANVRWARHDNAEAPPTAIRP